MVNRLFLRVVLTLVFALTAAGAIAGPAAAETIIQACNGTCGYYEIRDGGPPYGANCIYEHASHDLDKISVRPPLMHGPWSYKTKVRWLFRIFRSASMGGSWSQIYQSSWQNAMANDSIPAYAGQGFSRRTWTAPESPTGWFKVRILMHWFNQSGNRVGIAAAEIDNYKLLDQAVGSNTEYCPQDWP
ncbi:MAG: hypothetical protein ABIP53_06315 [Candidatus Limnocylindrales bacterium]